MRKIISFWLIVLTCCMLAACSNEAGSKEESGKDAFEPISIETPEDIDNFIIEKGYEIISTDGKYEEIKVNKKWIYHNSNIWAVQYSEPDEYMGKIISTYGYTVKNHLLDEQSPNHKTKLIVMVCDYKIIGGYSNPNYEAKDISLIRVGGVYSLEGKNFEDIKNISYRKWRDKFLKKYKYDT
jgi:hypothetical protein